MITGVSGHKNTAHSAPNSPLVRPAQPSRLWFGLPVATSQASNDQERDFPCECCDTDAEHDAALEREEAYWRSYFGLTGDKATDRQKLEAWAPFVKKSEVA